MASRIGKLALLSRKLFGSRRPAADPSRGAVGKQFVELENRSVPATFIVTNILDNQTDVVGGLSLRQAINAANGNPGFDRIEFNIPRSPSLPTIPNDPTESYFPIVLASTLPDLVDPAGVTIDATTQPRNNTLGTRPIVQLLPDPNPGAFPGQKGAFFISGPNNTIRGLVITGFPGAAMNFAGKSSHDNVIVGNWINTDITGTRSWNEDPFIASARPTNTPPELTNTGPLADGTVGGNKNPLFVLGGLTLTNGAHDNIIGGVIDEQAAPLADSGGRLIGTGGTISRYNSQGVLIDVGIPVTPALNRNIISGTPQFKKSYFNYTWAIDGSTKVRQDDIEGAAVGPGIRIMDPGTDRNLIQGNFIGTGITGNEPIPNHNGIEIFNNATGNLIGNPTTKFVGDPVAAGVGNLIRFNENDGIRLGDTPNPSQIQPPPPPVPGPPQPYQEGEDFLTSTTPGPFGPISQSGRVGGVFFDSYNPNYFHGISPTNTDILTINRTTLDFTDQDKTIDISKAVTTPGIAAQVGETIKITGTGLLATTAVTFNASKTSTPNPQSVPAKFVIVSDTELSVVVPAGALTPPPRVAPNADIPAVTVFTPAGAARIFDGVIYPAPPAIIEIVSTFSPSSGLAGSKVSIFGSGFVGAQSVTFGGIIATEFTVAAGGSRIDVTVPTGALSGPISITTPGGNATTTRDFRVETQPPPIVTGVNLASAIPGQEIILTGVNFTGAYLIRFNYTGGVSGFTTTNFTVDSATQIRVKVPALATASNGPIQVVTNDGFGVSTPTLQIATPPAPTIASLSSTSGPLGSVITIAGTNFTSANRVTFSGIDAQDFDILSANSIRAIVPFGIPVGTDSSVRVVSSGGIANFATPFTITASLQPTVDAIPFANRNTFTVVNGTNLSGTTKVLFGDPIGGIPSTSVEVLSDSQLRVLIPSAVASTGSFYVFTAYHTQNPLEQPAENTYTVSDTVSPIINDGRMSDPISGIIGSTVTLRGSGFIGTQNVFFTKAGGGVIAATNLVVVNDREINFRVPLLASSGNITVSTLGVSDTLQPFDPAFPNTAQPDLPINSTTNLTPSIVGFTLLASPSPFIDGIFPASGPVGTFMTITGRNLAGAAQVKVGSGIVDNYVIESDNIIKFRVPQLATNGPISITTPGGTAFSTTNFTLTPSPAPFIDYSSPQVPRGAQVTISGSGLAGTSKVLFNDVPAEFRIISDTLITAIVPVTAGPGEIRVFTPGGNVASPTPFTLSPLAAPVIQGVTNQDAAPVGGKITINTAANNVFRVEFAVPLSPPNSGTAANFVFGGGGLIVTVPELPAGEYEMRVFSSADQGDGNYMGDPLSYWDSSYSEAKNILGDTFIYGETIQVLPSARSRVDSVTTQDTDLFGNNVDFFRGAPIAIRGNGFTGANRIRFTTQADPFENKGTFVDIAGASGVGPNAPVEMPFTVVSDNLIIMDLPITQFAGADAIPGINVFVFTPNGVAGDTTDDLPSYQFDGTGAKVLTAPSISIAATPAFTFDVVDDISGAPSGATVTIESKTGNFFAANKITFVGYTQTFDAGTGKFSKGAQFTNGNLAQTFPVSGPSMTKLTVPIQNFQIIAGTGGTKANIVMPTFTQKTPDTVIIPPPANQAALPAPPSAGLFQLTTHFNDGVTAKSDATAAADKQFFFIFPFKAAGTINGLSKAPFNRVHTLTGSAALVSATGVVIEVRDANGNLGATQLNRNQFQATLTPGGAQIQFVNPTLRNPFDPRQTTAIPTGNYEVVHNSGDSTTFNLTPPVQTFPQIFAFAIPTDPPVDNRLIANRIFDNGVTIVRDPVSGFVIGVAPKGQDTKFTDGNLGIDFITQGNPGGAWPFAWGYAHTQQGPSTSPPPFPAGNQGRGGLNDGKMADSFIQSFPNNTFNNTQFGRFMGPNLLQNFPLLQVVQSAVDRTTFSTALLGKPFRSYRIDYYYNPGVDNSLSDQALDPFLASQSSTFTGSRFDDQDKTARDTTNIGSGQIYLGSKVITTDSQGDGSVNFIVYKRLPTDPSDPSSIPPLAPGEFQLPDNQPLVPSTIDPVTGNVTFRAGVVTATATDLTAPGPDGPILTTGPDGTSRFSFFKRVDTPTGAIGGRVIIDANADGLIDAGEVGLTGGIVSLFLQRDDGTYPTSPNVAVTVGDDGSYFFGSTGFGGLGLSNGKHKLALTLPTGGPATYYYEIPSDGVQFTEIISGETDSDVNFLVTTTPFGTPPTISDIPNQNATAGQTLVLPFTISDLETPANLLTLSVTSSNPGFIPLGSITFSGSGNNRFVTIITPIGVEDSSVITITVTDGNGLTASDVFQVNTGAVGPNTPPTISSIANQTATAGAPLGPISFTVNDAETPADNLIITAITSNGAVIPPANIVLGGSGTNRTVTINTPAGVIGSSTITLVVTDIGGLSAQSSFLVEVPAPPGTAPALLVVGSDSGRKGQVNVYNPNGVFRYTLTPYGDDFTGGVRVATGDVTGDGNADVLTAPGIGIPGLVKIYDGVTGNFIQQFLPYGDAFKGGVYVVTGDVDGDGVRDVVTGTGKGGGPRVRVLRGGTNGGSTITLETIADFFPYESNFRGGVLVSAGDVNGDGFADIATGTGPGGGPRVRVVDGTNLSSTPGVGTLYDFFAYDNRVRGGVFATIGDVDNDGSADIITGPGAAGPAVKIFKQSDISPGAPTFDVNGSQQFLASKSFFAYDPTNYNGGVRVDVIDGNGDGIADIVTGPGNGIGPDVRVVNYATLQDIYRIQAFEANFHGGVFVGGNLNK